MHDWIASRADWRKVRGEMHPMIACTLEAQGRGVKLDDMPLSTQWPLPNVWLGVSVETQETAYERVDHLIHTPAALRFISYEPALGPLHLNGWLYAGARPGPIGWVIAGGETGQGARPAHPDWFADLRDECVEAKVPFFFNQWGQWSPRSADRDAAWYARLRGRQGRKLQARMWSAGFPMYAYGREVSGRSLGDRDWSEFPCPPS